MTGLIGFSSGFHTMMNADTLILLGTQFPYRAFYPTDAKIIQIDINPASIGAHSKVDMALVGDIKSTPPPCCRCSRRKRIARFLIKPSVTTAMPVRGWTISPNRATKPSTRSTAQQISHFADDDAILPATSARQPSGQHAT